jgi:hypothetical protein
LRHLAQGAGSLVSRMWDMPDRAVYCPIVYNTLDYDTTSDDPQFCGKGRRLHSHL